MAAITPSAQMTPQALAVAQDDSPRRLPADEPARRLTGSFEAFNAEPAQGTGGAAGTFIQVGPDDTVWSLAGCRLYTGATAHQIVAALVKANPDAFQAEHNFNEGDKRLKPNVTRMFLPPLAEILAIDDEEAGNISATIRPGEQSLRRLEPGYQELIFGDDTLELLANRFDVDRATRSQKMAAIFNANPKAFKRGNMHAPKAGEVIILPTAKDTLAMEDKIAARMVANHKKQNDQYLASLMPSVGTAA